jgi:hypothetical protein
MLLVGLGLPAAGIYFKDQIRGGQPEIETPRPPRDLRIAPALMVEAVERFTGETCRKATWDVTDSVRDDYAIDCEGGWAGIKFYRVKIGPTGLRVTNKY